MGERWPDVGTHEETTGLCSGIHEGDLGADVEALKSARRERERVSSFAEAMNGAGKGKDQIQSKTHLFQIRKNAIFIRLAGQHVIAPMANSR